MGMHRAGLVQDKVAWIRRVGVQRSREGPLQCSWLPCKGSAGACHSLGGQCLIFISSGLPWGLSGRAINICSAEVGLPSGQETTCSRGSKILMGEEEERKLPPTGFHCSPGPSLCVPTPQFPICKQAAELSGSQVPFNLENPRILSGWFHSVRGGCLEVSPLPLRTGPRNSSPHRGSQISPSSTQDCLIQLLQW